MKFAHNYAQCLRAEQYPSQWLEAAIQYKELKKAIRKVENELSSRGLHPDLINLHWHPGGSPSLEDDDMLAGFHYTLKETGDPTQYLSPRFFLVIDRQRKDNDSVSCALTGQEELNSLCLPLETKLSSSTNTCASIPFTGPEVNSERQIVEIPLSYDAQFFDMVRLKLRALENLQLQQENEMSHNIQQLALQVTNDIQQPSPKSKSLIYTWREIFHLYTGFQVFFSTEERDGGQRSAASACQRFSNFEEALTKSHLARKLNKRGRHTLELFISFNKVLLRNIKFLEINAIALRKILKKFDKHTALHARPAFLNLVRPDIPTPENTAKSVCCVMSKDLIGLVPQLDDYLCPICFAIAFKPVRLRCGHVFCIRCLVVMQQRKQSHCALCRDESVLDATGENFDRDLEMFLARYFPKEVKGKLRDNQRASNLDVYGEIDSGCCMM